MDRMAFFNCISNVDYPEMIVKYFDQFAALHSIVQEFEYIQVDSTDENSISFLIEFSSPQSMGKVLSVPDTIVIYGRPLTIIKDTIEGNKLKLTIQ